MNHNSSTFVEIGSELSAEQLAQATGGSFPYFWPRDLARLAGQAGNFVGHALGDAAHAVAHAAGDVGNAVVDTGKKIVNFIGGLF